MDNAIALVQAYLRAHGYFTVTEFPVVEALRHGHAVLPNGLQVRLLAFGSTLDGAGGGYRCVTLGSVVAYLRRSVRNHFDAFRAMNPRDPASGFLLTLEMARRGAGADGSPAAPPDDARSAPPAAADTPHVAPVLVDDIISTARTMIATVGHLRRAGLPAPVCVGIHAIFAGGAHEVIAAAGAARVVSCNTVAHPANAIDATPALATAVYETAEWEAPPTPAPRGGAAARVPPAGTRALGLASSVGAAHSAAR